MFVAALALLLATPAPAARGLDLYMFGATEAPSGSSVPLEVVVLGFPTVTTLAPVAQAEVEAVWSPDSVGVDLPPIRARADARGRALLRIPVPEGEPRSLELLVRARGGGRERTRTVAIQRTRELGLRLHLADTRVVPGSVVSAWVVAEQTRDQVGLPYTGVDVELLEGGYPRWRQRVITDRSGSASVRVPVPRTAELAWRWTLRATLAGGARAEATLAVREETPATPSLRAAFDRGHVAPGDRAIARVRVLDAAGKAVGGAPLVYWMGSRGTEPKDDKAWRAAATATRTPTGGELVLGRATPTTIAPTGNDLTLLVKAEFDGHRLESRAMVAIGRVEPLVELVPEVTALVPGVPQRLLLRVLDDAGRGVRGRFELSGDGLAVTVTTDEHGEAPATWRVPSGVGATHPNGSCASSVAATVVIRALDGLAAHLGRERFERCLVVDRDRRELLVADRPVVRAGDAVTVRVLGGAGRSYTVLAVAQGAPLAQVVLEDGARGGALTLPAEARGLVQLTAAAVDPRGAAHLGSAAVLALPRVIPTVRGRVIGGRAVPGGVVEIEALLTDEAGRPLTGLVSATVHDLFGGGSTLRGLDARERLAAGLDLGAGDRLDALFDGDAAKDAWRRAALASQIAQPLTPIADPASDAEARFAEAFAQVIRSLEGALLEATQEPDRLGDVRRKTARGYELNPEMLTLVTAAMETPPLTPGGEPIVLDDLMALDPQVRFDRVARRIARLKLFWVLEAVRSFVYEHRLLPDELAMEAPDAILRRLVREGALAASALVDPWGGSIGFVKSEGPRVPYLSLIRGFTLQAAGPDGRLGTEDDVRDPFERVLASGSPYARAVDEDRLVDARYEVVVGDDTVAAWRSLFEALTGTTLGGVVGGAMGGVGLGGMGTGGGGYGAGTSRARGTVGVATVSSRWIPPVRTDEHGRAVLRVPLGDAETTWRVTLIGAPDSGLAATAIVDVPAFVPLSARVDAGAVWTVGDEVTVAIEVRNRQPHAVTARLQVTAEGALTRVGDGELTVEVPADGATRAPLVVRAARPGPGVIAVETRSEGTEPDRVRHTLDVRPAGTEGVRWTSRWIADRATLALPPLGRGESAYGLARLHLTRGVGTLAGAALESLDPDRATNAGAAVEAYELARRVSRWAGGRLGGDRRLAAQADALAQRALGRALQYRTFQRGAGDAGDRRLATWSPTPIEGLVAADCPTSALGPIDVIELEPTPVAQTVTACWENAVSTAVQALIEAGRSELLARAIIALAERPHRAGLATNLAQRLRERGPHVVTDGEREARDTRALVAAARLAWPQSGDDSAEALTALADAQAADGGFGASATTRAVVTALLARDRELGSTTTATVTLTTPAPAPLVLALRPEGTSAVTLTREAPEVTVEIAGGGAWARIAAPILRAWDTPPPPRPGPTEVQLEWPSRPRAGQVAPLRCLLRHTLSTPADVEVRVPLPPGVTLAEGRSGVTQVQGVLVVRASFRPSGVPAWIDVPLRFTLPGTVTAPEARARVVGVEGSEVYAPAAALVITEGR